MQLYDALNALTYISRSMGSTLLVTLTCFTSAFIIGLTVAALRRLSVPVIVCLVSLLVYIFRSIPVLILLFLTYFGFPSVGLTLSPLTAMNIAVGLISGSYLAEVFRGALSLVDPQEKEAAHTSGLSNMQIVIFIEFPQMLRFAVPGILNEFSSVLKASPFAYVVGIPEMTKQAMTLTAVTMNGLVVYSMAGVLYFLIFKFFALITRFYEYRLHMTDDELNEIRMRTYDVDKNK